MLYWLSVYVYLILGDFIGCLDHVTDVNNDIYLDIDENSLIFVAPEIKQHK